MWIVLADRKADDKSFPQKESEGQRQNLRQAEN